MINHLRVVNGYVNWRVPVKAVLLLACNNAEAQLLIGLDRSDGSCFRVEFLNQAQVAAGVGKARVLRIESDVCAFAAAMNLPVIASNAAVPRTAPDCNRRVVLLASVNSVLKLVVGIYPVELCGWLVVLPRPTGAAVK